MYSSFSSLDSPYSGAGTASIEQSNLGPRDIVNLEELASSGGIYRIRIPVGQNSFVSASVPACQLLASGFSDEIDVHLSASKVIGVSYHVSSTKCAKKSVVSSSSPFQTRALVKHAEDAPRPNLDPHGLGHPQPSPNAPAIPAQEVVDDRSFFAKYVRPSSPQSPSIVLSLTSLIDILGIVALHDPDSRYALALDGNGA